ncbi:hypothetical protein [Oceanobacillus damuensis]|uniref:hypothetical protein n=1 Tax=Oceanobacillus damuensis TaxID=937928 RepID=UPI000836C565|nr:hypothetical protein [Oceanobacillus damuensis]
MFILQRRMNGSREILTKSSSHLKKTFLTYDSALLFANKINSMTKPNRQWDIALKSNTEIE